ncbi:MAG: GAF domain-containing sensor histidine kinase [Microcoleaceae cyanobacterium]
MRSIPIPELEMERLEVLESYQILDTPPEKEYDDLTKLASGFCNTPIALVSLIDRERQWFKSRIGLEVTETSRELAFCAHAICQPGKLLIIPDTFEDERFFNHPLVTSEPHIRFYAGTTLLTPDGHALGTLCVIDRIPRTLTSGQVEAMEVLGRQVASQMELRLQLFHLQRTQAQLIEKTTALSAARESVDSANRAKSEFLANVSHELRTPPKTILGMTKSLQEQIFGPLTDRQLQALQVIECNSSHLLGLVNSILEVTEIETGEIKLNRAPTVIASLCESSLSLARGQARQKYVCLKTIIHQVPDLCIDEKLICQALTHLLNNAVKFTPEGGQVTLEVSYNKELSDLGLGPVSNESLGILQIDVVDTGIGIAPEDLNQIFRPFSRIDNSQNRKRNGVGLGLALVKRIVELHDGQIQVDSKIGVGSHFKITLPCNAVL